MILHCRLPQALFKVPQMIVAAKYPVALGEGFFYFTVARQRPGLFKSQSSRAAFSLALRKSFRPCS